MQTEADTLTVAQAADFHKLTRQAIIHAVQQGKIRVSATVERRFLLCRADVEAYEPRPKRYVMRKERVRKPLRMEPTPRQKELLQLAAQGLTDREIAERLGIKRGSVTGHIFNAMQMLGCNRRAEACRLMGYDITPASLRERLGQ